MKEVIDNRPFAESSMYQTITNERLYEAVVNQLEGLIISGQLSPGDAIPPERRLSELLGVSRSVVREAMRILERAGLIVIKPGRGAFVQDPSSQSISKSLLFLIQMRAGTVEDCLEFRRYLEPEIAYLAAERHTDEDIREMEFFLQEMEKDKNNPEHFIEHDQAFHSAVAESTRNPVFLLVLDTTIDLLHEMRQKTMYISTPFARDRKEHTDIFEQIKARDAAGARAAMIVHLQSVARQLEAVKQQPTTIQTDHI